MTRFRWLAVALTLAFVGCGSGSAPSDPVRRAQDAAAIVRAAAEAMGGHDALRAATTLTFDYRGDLHWVHQGQTDEQSLRIGIVGRHFADLAARRLAASHQLTTPNSTFTRSGAIDAAASPDEALVVLARAPHAVLREALERPRDLQLLARSAGAASVSASLYGRAAQLHFDADNLLVRVDVLDNDARRGDTLTSVEYNDYADRGGVWAPGRIRETSAGAVTLDVEVVAYAFNTAAPDWAPALLTDTSPAPQAPNRAITQTLAPGVHLVVGHAGPDYYALAVELDDGMLLLETPDGDPFALATALSSISAKPLRFAAATHHHEDHSAGAAALDAGVTFLATAGAADFFRDMTAAPRVFRLGRAARAPLTIRVLEQGERIGPVQFFNVGPSEHAAEHLIFYFPEHGIIFQSDLVRFPAPEQTDVDRPQVCTFYEFIRDNNLRVTQIVGGHGQIGTMADLENVVSRRATPCRS